MEQTSATITFGDQTFLLLASGCLFWAEREMLVVSDLHFEKGSFFSGLGNPLPLLDTLDTLKRLRQIMAEMAPREVLCLGDSFHDKGAFARMAPRDLSCINRLVGQVQRWTWVLGNHDPDLPDTIHGHKATQLQVDGLMFSHEPEDTDAPQVVGHFHPKHHYRIGGQRLSGRCFVHTESLLVMPSFGTYTGGLAITDPALATHLGERCSPHLLWRNKIWPLPQVTL